MCAQLVITEKGKVSGSTSCILYVKNHKQCLGCVVSVLFMVVVRLREF